ncbi:hypothetical protein MMC19_001434 [Ptychographa xylographoides]|nr:hypothetical protein [Ptychographa xylographoides]
MAASMLQYARTEKKLQLVAMNQVEYLQFDLKIRICLGTEALNSCTAVVILSKNAAVLDHFALRPASVAANITAGDTHIKAIMDKLRALLVKHLQDLISGSAGIVVLAVYLGAPALQSQKEIIESQFKAWKMSFKSILYTVSDAGQPRAPTKGTVLIVLKDGGAEVYVEDN